MERAAHFHLNGGGNRCCPDWPGRRLFRSACVRPYTESILEDDYAIRTDHPYRIKRGETAEYGTMEQDVTGEAADEDHARGLDNEEDVQERQKLKRKMAIHLILLCPEPMSEMDY